MAVMLGLVTIALYWPTTQCDFLQWDDDLFVTSNVHAQNGLTFESLKWAFLNPVAWNWHPITMLSHMVDCQLFGLKPWGHHLTSVLLHAINTFLVFLLLRRLTGALWRSLMVAALFGLHPVHVESVAWIAERKDVLSMCFGLLALLFYARYAQRRSQGADHESPAARSKLEVGSSMLDVQSSSAINYSLSLFFFALGLMSKPMLVTWPFVMLLLDYWPLRRFRFSMPPVGRSKFVFSHPCLILGSRPSAVQSVANNPGLWRLVFEKIPFFALSAAASVVTFVVQKKGGAVMPVENLSLSARSANALVSCCRYLGKMFWPTDLAVFYPHPGHWPIGEVLLAGGVLLGIAVLFIVKRRQYPFLLMGWLWYCGTLVPVIGLVQVFTQAMADRYAYIPSLGVLLLATWGAYELARRWRHHVIALSMVSTAALVLCLTLTRQQIGYWKDSEALFRHALKVTENNPFAHNSLGVALVKKGQIDEAICQFREAIRLKPDYAGTYNNLGVALVKKGQIEEAINQYREAICLKPDDADPYNNLGAALGRKGHINEAIRQFQESLHFKPDYAEAHYNLGTALAMKGQIDEAICQFQEAVRLKPDYAEARKNLRSALLKKDQTDEPIK